MPFEFELAPDHVERCTRFIAACKQNATIERIMRDRTRSFDQRTTANIDRQTVWRKAVIVVCTSQTRSFGPNNPIQRMINANPALLSWEQVEQTPDILALCEAGIERDVFARGRKAGWIAELRRRLLHEWGPLYRRLVRLRDVTNNLEMRRLERETARWINLFWDGFGPKQARNFLQDLGLACYEVPIDSRVFRHLAVTIGLPIVTMEEGEIIPAINLSVAIEYEWLLDVYQELSDKTGVLPTILDACLAHSPPPIEPRNQ